VWIPHRLHVGYPHGPTRNDVVESYAQQRKHSRQPHRTDIGDKDHANRDEASREIHQRRETTVRCVKDAVWTKIFRLSHTVRWLIVH